VSPPYGRCAETASVITAHIGTERDSPAEMIAFANHPVGCPLLLAMRIPWKEPALTDIVIYPR
jgi:hypothetical protein